jgi:hypothetical protein
MCVVPTTLKPVVWTDPSGPNGVETINITYAIKHIVKKIPDTKL